MSKDINEGEEMKDELLEKYAPQLAELLPLARRAYGSRDIVSPQHDASREYTRLLVEFYNQGGSLLQLATRLGVTYAGIRRRVITVDIPASTSKKRSKATPAEVQAAAERVKEAKLSGGTVEYHLALRHEYEVNGVSLTKISKALGLSSANPLYYAVARTKIRETEL
jgi:transposase